MKIFILVSILVPLNVFSIEEIPLKTLSLPSAPCSCIVSTKIEKRCVYKSKVENLEKIKNSFHAESKKCDPRAGCVPGFQVQYEYCLENSSETSHKRTKDNPKCGIQNWRGGQTAIHKKRQHR